MHTEDDPGDLHRPPEEGIPRGWRRAGVVAGVVAFGLMAGAIHVSTYEVDYGTRVHAEEVLAAGGRWTLRIAVFDREASDYVHRLVVNARLERGDRSFPLGAGTASGTLAVELNVPVPDELEPGPWELVVEVETSAGEPETARLPVEVVADVHRPAGAWLSVRPVCEEGSRLDVKGELAPSARCRRESPFALYPESGHLVSNLDNEVAVWAGPDATGVSVAELPSRASPVAPAPDPARPPQPVQIDAIGLGWFKASQMYPRGEIRLVTGDLSEDLWLREVPSQILIRSYEPLRPPGGPLTAEIAIVRSRRPVYLDTWAKGRWVGAGSAVVDGDKPLAYEVALPTETEGLAVLRAYTHMSSPAAAYDDQVFFMHPEGGSLAALRAFAKALAPLPLAEPLAPYLEGQRPGPDPLIRFVAEADEERLSGLGSFARQQVARALASRVVVTTAAAPLLGDTMPAKQAALEAWKSRVRRPVLWGLLLLAGAVILGASWLVVENRRTVRRRLAELEADDTSPADEETAPIGRAGLLVPALALLLLVSSAVAAVFILLETLRWDWGR